MSTELMKIRYYITIILYLFASLLSPESKATQYNYQDYTGKGLGHTKEEAIKRAYWSIIEEKLTQYSGADVDRELGDYVKKEFNWNVEGFIRDFFEDDRHERCQIDNKKTHCIVEATLKNKIFKVRIKNAIKKIYSDKSKYEFTLSAIKSDNPETNRIIKNITFALKDAFMWRSSKFSTESKSNRLVLKNKDHFRLGIYNVTQVFNHNAQNYTTEGIVNMRFGVIAPQSEKEIFSVTINSREEQRGGNEEVAKTDLEVILSNQIANKIAAQAIAAVHEYITQSNQADNKDLNRKIYSIRIQGLSRKSEDLNELITIFHNSIADSHLKFISKKYDKQNKKIMYELSVPKSFSTENTEHIIDTLESHFSQRNQFNARFDGYDAIYITF